jgi:predicted nucleic acid-binding protein
MATGIQESELRNTSDEARRNVLLDAFEMVQPDWVPVARFVFDMAGAGWDQGSWGLNDKTHQAILARLRELDRKRAKASNQVGDVLIAKTAMQRGAVLVSGDRNLRTMASDFGVEVMSLEEFTRE